MGWIDIKPMTCNMINACSGPDLVLAPGQQARHAIDLGPGYYALVCASPRADPHEALVIDGRCGPARFTVGMGSIGPGESATPAT